MGTQYDAAMLRRLCSEWVDYVLTLARLTVLDWGWPLQETETDRAIRGQSERLRAAFPWLDERRRR
jgi:hypothetical protein